MTEPGATNGSNIEERNAGYHAFDERNKRRDNRIRVSNRSRYSSKVNAASREFQTLVVPRQGLHSAHGQPVRPQCIHAGKEATMLTIAVFRAPEPCFA
jgi:hypothetical protein